MAAETANALIGALSKVARWAVAVGIGSSALQTSLYTGAFLLLWWRDACSLSPPRPRSILPSTSQPRMHPPTAVLPPPLLDPGPVTRDGR